MDHLRHLSVFSVAAILGGLAVMCAASPAAAEGPPTEAVDQLSQQVQTLEETYLVPAVLESRFQLESRFNEAKVAYLLGDYERASIMFVAIVDTEDGQRFAGEREALYLLGDSLYEMRSFRASRGYFEQVVDQGPGPFYQASIVRMLEIAAETGDYSGVDELYDRLDDLENVSPSIHYVRGTTLFREGRARSARPWFQRAAQHERYAFTARYYEAVALVGAEEFAEAREIFDQVTRQQATSPEDQRVKELALLALGRLAYEEEDYSAAVDHYLQLPRTSPLFTRALYELTWALVAQGNYRSALRNLDILLISDPDPRFVPEAKSLMADMAMRLREYDDARNWFEELVDTFTPVREELQGFLEEHQDIDEFFVSLVREELAGLRPDFLPEMVSEWVDDSALMESARQLVIDGVGTQDDIDEIYESIEEIEAVLDMGSSIEAFPQMSEGWIQGVELEARLVDIQDQLLDWELQQVRPLMGSSEQARLAEIEEELEELRRQEASVPRTRAELKERDQEIAERFRLLRTEVDQVAFEISDLEKTLDGIAQYMRRESDRLTDEERQQVRDVRRELLQDVSALEEERHQLSRQLDQTKRAFGARDDSLVRHRELRREIQELQSQRAEMADATADQLGATDRSEVLEVSRVRRQLPAIGKRLDDYFNEMDSLVEERMADIQATLDAERAQLAQHQTDLDTWNAETEGAVAEVAMWNFIEVNREFDTLVQRGHMGLVDVDWQQLEDARHDRQTLQDDKMETQEMLREAFPDVQ